MHTRRVYSWNPSNADSLGPLLYVQNTEASVFRKLLVYFRKAWQCVPMCVCVCVCVVCVCVVVSVSGLLVAYWLKHWTVDRKVQGSSPICSRDIIISLLGTLSPTSKIE